MSQQHVPGSFLGVFFVFDCVHFRGAISNSAKSQSVGVDKVNKKQEWLSLSFIFGSAFIFIWKWHARWDVVITDVVWGEVGRYVMLQDDHGYGMLRQAWLMFLRKDHVCLPYLWLAFIWFSTHRGQESKDCRMQNDHIHSAEWARSTSQPPTPSAQPRLLAVDKEMGEAAKMGLIRSRDRKGIAEDFVRVSRRLKGLKSCLVGCCLFCRVAQARRKSETIWVLHLTKEWLKARPCPGYYDVPLMVSFFSFPFSSLRGIEERKRKNGTRM